MKIIKLIHPLLFLFIATAVLVAGQAAAKEAFDPKTEKTLIQMMQESPDAIPLEPRDPSRDVRILRRDAKTRAADRKPGPINIQQTIGGTAFIGIPTFFKSPVALTPEDLIAGKVDIAIMGAAFDLSTGMRGTAYGPTAIRAAERYAPWGEGELFKLAHRQPRSARRP